MVSIGVDVGGTFTDFVVLDDETNEISIKKVPSTPADPAEAILHGLELFIAEGLDTGNVASFLHGTTITTNALIQRRGCKAGLVLTRGLRGIYQVASQMRTGPEYGIANDRPVGLVDMGSVF